jgi:hypothetical protein
MHGAGDLRVETVSDDRLIEPTRCPVARGASLRLWQRSVAVQDMEPDGIGRRMGHEAIGTSTPSARTSAP